jgi:hypothetical protein
MNFKILLVIVAILIAVVPALTGCAFLGTGRVEGHSGSVTVHQGGRHYSDAPPVIPQGHMPLPGNAAFGIRTVRLDNNHPQAIAESLNIRFHQVHGLYGVNSDSVRLSPCPLEKCTWHLLHIHISKR